jgi:hypothetical protein
LRETGRDKAIGTEANRHLKKIAEGVKVRLGRTEKGWRLIPVEGAEECRKVV